LGGQEIFSLPKGDISPEFFDDIGHYPDNLIDLFFSVITTQRKRIEPWTAV